MSFLQWLSFILTASTLGWMWLYFLGRKRVKLFERTVDELQDEKSGLIFSIWGTQSGDRSTRDIMQHIEVLLKENIHLREQNQGFSKLAQNYSVQINQLTNENRALRASHGKPVEDVTA